MPWNQDQWQDFNMKLAARFHNGVFQAIPDQHGGDGGLEGFSRDAQAVGYQCYVPEEDAQTGLTERIIAKINKDTLKLKSNRDFFGKTLVSSKLKRWTLLIPKECFRDQAIVEHTGKRAEEVRSWKLPFIDDDFCITVSSGEEFDAALDEFRKLGKARIDIGADAPTQAERDQWEQKNAQHMPVLDDKLNRSDRPKAAIKVFRNDLIKCAVIAQNAFSQIKREDPDGWEQLVRAKADKGAELVNESALNTAIPADFLKQTINNYKTKVLQVMPSATEGTARILANEAVVEWLLTCPLNFYTDSADGN